jgi:hypothetical protein
VGEDAGEKAAPPPTEREATTCLLVRLRLAIRHEQGIQRAD